MEKTIITPEIWKSWGNFGGSIVTKKDASGKDVQACWIKFSALDNGTPINLSKTIWMDAERVNALCENKAESIRDRILAFYKAGNDLILDVATSVETGEVLKVKSGPHAGETIYQLKKMEHLCDAGELTR